MLVAKPSLSSFAALVLGLVSCGEATPEAASKSVVAKTDAGPPDFATDVAPLLYAKCATCHHPGGPGPFPLIEYGDVSDHGQQIVDVTHSGYMPPWLPKPGDVAFEYEQQRRLTDAEKQLLADWVAAGMPSGDLSRTPPAPKFEAGWQLGEPDLILEAEYAFELRDDRRSL